MNDYSEIKQLAEAAIPVNSELLGDRYLCGAGSIAKLDAAQGKFYEVATPALVVSLIKDLESHKRMLLAAACDIGAIGKALKADMDADGDELLGMVIDLKAQNSRMLEWLKDISRTSGDKGAVMGARQLLKEFRT